MARKIQPILLLYFVVTFLGLIILFIFDKASIHIFINERANPALDFFFKYFTHLGDGLFSAVVIVIFLFIKFRYSIIQLIAFLLSGLGTQLMKRYFFSDIVRPARYFEETYDLYFVEGVRILKSFSFPSGHTATAFALFFCLIFFTKNKSLQILLFIVACLVGFSRMYLSHHFLPDVLAGSLLGVISVLIAFKLSNSWKAPWLDKSIVSLIKSKKS